MSWGKLCILLFFIIHLSILFFFDFILFPFLPVSFLS